MRELIKLLPRLGAGVSKDVFPLYGPFLHSDGQKVVTCNDEVYIETNIQLPFIGSVNFFVLDKLLKSTSEKLNIQKQESSQLSFVDGSLSSNLSMLEMEYPSFKKPDIKMVEVTGKLYNSLLLSTKFLGSGIYSNICVDAGVIISTDTSKIFFSVEDLVLSERMSLNSKIVSFLKVGDKIGTHNNNVVVEFEGGFGIFTSEDISRYPVTKIMSFIDKSKSSLKKICSINVVKEECAKLSHIFFGELIQEIEFSNEDYSLVMSAESVVNGKSQTKVKSDLQDKFSIKLDYSYLSHIPSSYLMYRGDVDDKLLFKHEKDDSIIVLMQRR